MVQILQADFDPAVPAAPVRMAVGHNGAEDVTAPTGDPSPPVSEETGQAEFPDVPGQAEETLPESGSADPGESGQPAPTQQPVQSEAPSSSDRQQVLPSDSQTEVQGGDGQTAPADAEQVTLTAIPPREDLGVLPALLPAAGGLLAAIALGALAVWLRRRKRQTAYSRPAPPLGEVKPLHIRAAHLHELGDRDSQQDAFVIAGPEHSGQRALAAVADGMGGLVNSGQVSRTLVQALEKAYRREETCPPDRQLQLMFQQALGWVEEQQKGSSAQSGSTLVMALIRDGGLSWLSVGDSRIYLWRGGGLIQLNRDHDFHHDLVLLALQGDMALEEADRDPRRENLTSYIGRGFPRKVEWNPEPVLLQSGDRVLLVSDGVYRALSQEEMAACLSGTPEEAAQNLHQAIAGKAFPQQDNYTSVIIAV